MLLFPSKNNCHSHHFSLGTMRALPLAFFALIVAATVAVSCKEEKKEIMSGSTDPETTPTMSTRDVVTLISDSGITRYHINTPIWNVYDEAEEPSWKFPEGLHIQTYDMKMKPEATIDCDSAIYLKNKQIWHLMGYVNIRNTIGEKFLTEELYWNQSMRKVYSDSFIHIEREQKTIEGYGFESNETMTNYHVKKVSGIFPANQFKPDTSRRAVAPATPATPAKPAPAPSSPKPSSRKISKSTPPVKVQDVNRFERKPIRVPSKELLEPKRLDNNPN